MKLVVGICDDDMIQVDTISKFLERNIKGYQLQLIKAYSGEQLLLKLSDVSPDIVFLDVEMKELNGLQTGKKIREKFQDAIIVFITGYKHFALEAFELKTMDYIVKPITESRLKSLLDDVLTRYEQLRVFEERNKTITFTFKDNTHRLRYSDIFFFEKNLRKFTVHSTQGEFSFYENMESLQHKLDHNQFIQCHNSYIVNKFKVLEMKNDSIYFKELNKSVPVSRKNKVLIREILENNMFQ